MRPARSLLVLLLTGASAAGLATGAWGQEEDGSAAETAETSKSPPPSPLAMPSLSYTLRQGETLFLHYCATCHGLTGRGDGFNAYSLDPKPRDLSDREFLDERSDEELAAVVRTGGGAIGLSTAMPPWGRTLSARQIDQLVAYVRELPARADQASAEP